MNRRSLVLTSAVALVLVLAGGSVYAARRFGGGHMMKAHVVGFLDEALQKNPLSAQQKQAIEAAIDKAHAQAQANKADRQAAIDQALNLFQADTLDTQALQSLQAQHMQQMAGHLIPVISEVHDILSPAQRQELVAAIRDHMAQHQGGGFGGF